jgi:hypothetical protein
VRADKFGKPWVSVLCCSNVNCEVAGGETFVCEQSKALEVNVRGDC